MEGRKEGRGRRKMRRSSSAKSKPSRLIIRIILDLLIKEFNKLLISHPDSLPSKAPVLVKD